MDASSPKPGHKRQRSQEQMIEPEVELTFTEEEERDANSASVANEGNALDQAGAALAIGNEEQEEREESTGDYSTPHNLIANWRLLIILNQLAQLADRLINWFYLVLIFWAYMNHSINRFHCSAPLSFHWK